MRLNSLLQYQNIVIQCHNNPDADTIASAFGVYTYLQQHKKKVRLVYGGHNKIQKANLVIMCMKLGIPIEHVEQLDSPDMLVTVDCQYGEGNVEYFPAKNVAIIDHHQISVELPECYEIRSNIGACSTIVWDMLRQEGMDVAKNKPLITALQYGLLTDTNNYAEIYHPLDKDLRDVVGANIKLINRFRNSNLSLDELGIAGNALSSYHYNDEYRYAIVEAEPCDPNILGMISDMILEVDVVDACFVYSVLPVGIKVSVRSCVKEIKACELVQYMAEGIGSGGGHLQKAGGFLQLDLLPCKTEDILSYLQNRFNQYFEETDIIYAKDYQANLLDMKPYKKAQLTLGFVKSTDVFSPGEKINIRTIEGDLDVVVSDDIYIMIGLKGEVYPINREKFERGYQEVDIPYEFKGEYCPTVIGLKENGTIQIVPYAKSCITTGEVYIYAKQLEKRVKIFTAWDKEKYVLGNVGDYLAVRKDDLHDVYVIEQNIFYQTYQQITI